MASLYSYFKKKQFMSLDRADWSAEDLAKKHEQLDALVAMDYKLVNITPIYVEACELAKERGYFFGAEGEEWRCLPPVTPGFPAMWLEGKFEELRGCAIIIREEATGEITPEGAQVKWKFLIVTGMWTTNKGLWMGISSTMVYLSEAGRIVDMTESGPEDEDPESSLRIMWDNARGFSMAVANALARMNCRNVELRVAGGAPKVKPGSRQMAPSSYWHEIVVTSVPKFRSVRESESDRSRQLRSHWVSGHYADYSAGRGLFGRLKGVFWMPEHHRGDEGLGTVCQSYKVG